MKKYLLVIILVVVGLSNTIGTAVQAQSYFTVVGVRGGLPGGVSVKHLIDGGLFGLEGIVGADYQRNFNLVGLFTYQGYISRNMNWYAGGGASFLSNRDYIGAGVDAVGGLELTFDNYPVNVAFDLKPRFKIVERQFAWYEMGLSVRYILR